MKWILLVLLYGLLKGGREITKKLAMQKNTVLEVLVAYTIISFLFVIPQAPNAGGMQPRFFFYIAIKSFCIFLAWICGFNALKKLPVSLYGILALSRILFSTFCGIVFLGESLGLWQAFGLVVVCTGLLMLRFQKKEVQVNETKASDETPVATTHAPAISQTLKIFPANSHGFFKKNADSPALYIFLAFASAILNAVSGFLDKILMKDLTSSQLQFWYMLFLVAYYLIYMLFRHQKFNLNVSRNIWVWLLAVMFVAGDKALFIANGIPESKVTIMTLIKQSSCIVTIIGGRLVFKEKNIAYKLLCAAIIIAGILMGLIQQ